MDMEPVKLSAPISRGKIVLISLLALLMIVMLARLLVGEAVPHTPDGAVDWPTLWTYISLRRDRMLLGLIVGAALGVSGAVLQSLLRNPLAEPYILGVSSGASLGVVIAWTGVAGAVVTHIAALGGALMTMLIVYLLAQKRGRIDPVGLLLIGVIVNALNGAAITFINYLAPHLRSNVSRWMMGSLDEDTGWKLIVAAGLVTLGGTAVAAALGRAMDVATFSDAEARSLGVRLSRLRLGLFAVAGMLVAASVTLAGPIGFVGLICPHGVRLLVGPSNRAVVLGSAMAGAILVVAADTAIKLASVYMNIGLMPIGVLTALIGGPMFLFMLRPQLGRGAE